MKVSINPAAVFAELDDGAVILNVDTGIYYGLDQVGTRIWTLVGSGASSDAIVDQLATEYAAPRDQITTDVTSLLQALQGKGLVQATAS